MPSNSPDAAEPRSTFITAQDGLRLHVREYGVRTAPALPVVCLPGLTRTADDFDTLGPALANGKPARRVVAIESRGRGQSEYDKNPENYNVAVELADIVTILSALGIREAVFVGSSRGGILTMLLVGTHPTFIAGAVLHDIGPVIEAKGLARIKSYVGKLPQPRDLAEGADILRRLFSDQFPKLTTADWAVAAKHAWKVADGLLVPTHDVRIALPLAAVDLDQPLPAMWAEFDALARVPVLVIRGQNSDLLSPATVAQMKEHDPAMELIEVPDQGHVPLLAGDALLGQIAAFVGRCDAAAHQRANSAGAALLGGAQHDQRDQRWR